MATVGINEQYTSAFTLDKFLTSNQTIKSGQFNILGEYKIEAGEMVRLGAGDNNSQEGAYGRIYLDLKDTATTPANLDGVIRFSVHSPQGRPLRILKEFHTSELRTDSSNRTLQVPLSAFGPFISEDKKIVLEFSPSAVGTGSVNASASKLTMNVTQAVV